MPVLKNEVKLFIVQELTRFDTPSQVVEAVKEEFGLELERSHVQVYDPTKRAGKDLSAKFKTIFDETRKEFLDDIAKIPIASQSFRLRSLQRSYEFFTQRKNYVQANLVLEQAAKEVGGMFTNKVKVGTDANDPFIEMLRQFTGGSMPVVHDVEGEFAEVGSEPETPKKVKKIEFKPSVKIKHEESNCR